MTQESIEIVNAENIEITSPKNLHDEEERHSTNESSSNADIRQSKSRLKSCRFALRGSLYNDRADGASYSFDNRAYLTLGKENSYIKPHANTLFKIDE